MHLDGTICNVCFCHQVPLFLVRIEELMSALDEKVTWREWKYLFKLGTSKVVSRFNLNGVMFVGLLVFRMSIMNVSYCQAVDKLIRFIGVIVLSCYTCIYNWYFYFQAWSLNKIQSHRSTLSTLISKVCHMVSRDQFTQSLAMLGLHTRVTPEGSTVSNCNNAESTKPAPRYAQVSRDNVKCAGKND